MSEQLDKLRKLTSRTWLNSGNSSAIVNESKDDEPGFLESAWGNFKGGAEGAISGIANFAGANLKALADNPYLNKWLSAKGLEAQGQAITNNGYNGPNLYQPVTESNPTPYKETIQKNADALLNEGAYLDTLAQDNIRKYGSRDSYGGLWDRVSNFDYWTDPRGAIADISQGVGSTLPSLAASVVIPGAGAAKIGGTVTKGIDLLSGITGKKLASAAIGKGAESVANHMIKWGVGGGLTEAVSDAGSIYNDLKEQGYSDVDIANTINKLAINEAPYLMASDALTGALITGKMGLALKKNKYLGGNDWYKKIARNIMTGVPLNMAGEYITEMKQQQLQKEYTNKPYGTLFNPMSDEEQAGAMGAIGALGFAGIGGIRGGINRTYNALVKNKVNNTNANNISIPKGIENADAWKAATIAANDVGRPDLAKAIYSQWALESGRFSADNAVRTNNFGGLKDPNTSENRLQRFDSIEEFAHEYARQTLKNYDLNKIREGNIGDFSHVLKENGYYGASEEKYTSDLESIASEIEDSTNSISLPDKKYYNILGEVSDTGLTTLTEQKLNLLARDFYNKFGYNLDVTSMKRNGDGSSWHDSGQAIDVANDLLASDPEARAWLIKQGEKYGLTSLDEYTNPSANATGGHIHFSDHGEPIPGVSTQVDSAPSIDNSTANDFYNNDSYVLNNDYSNMKADDISLYEPAQAEHKAEKNDNSDLDTLSEDEKWDIVDEEIEKAQTDGNILYLDKLTKIKRNNNINALDNLIDNIKKTDKKFLTKLQTKRASNFTSEQQGKIDSAIQEQNKLYSENKTLETAKKAEEIEYMKKGFMADNAFEANKNKDNKPKFDINKLKILGNNLLKQLEKSNNELQNTNPIVNYDKIKASLDSNDINRQRDAITAIQYLLNASNNDKKTSKAMLLEGLNNPNNRIANDWYNKINNNLDINNIKTFQKGETSKKEITIDNTENINSYIKKLIDNLNSSQDTLSQEDINRLYDSIKNKSLAENQEQKYQNDYSIEQLAKSIERAKKYKEFINSLSEEEALAMDYLDYTFKDTGKSFVDVLNLLKNEQEQDIQNYMEILRSQMKKGVVARSVYYNEKTDEYINSPGFSNNYQWYRDIMKARDYRPLGKNDIEGYLRDTAIEHLSYGYEDPQYGMQIPPEVANEFRRREDAINGLETIADKAKQYEQGRQLPRENQTSSRSNETNIQQKQKEIDIEAAKNIGKLLFDKVQEKQLKVDLNNLEQAISSDNINRVNKANDFMQRKLEPILNDKEKQQIQKTLDDNKIEADIKKEDLSTSETQSIENNSEQSDINRSSFDLKTNVSSNNISDNQKKSEVNENELNDSSNTVVARDKQGNNKDNVGKDDESHRSSREDGRDIRTNGGEGPRQDSSTSIRGDSTNIGGKTSNSTIRQEKSANTDNSTRDTKLSRSVTDSYERPLVDETTTERITDFVNESLFDESTIDKQKQINTKDIKVGNLESIKNDLPLLLPEQQDDVFKAETRMFVNNKLGMLFTNGTGTGKTFTGLGIVKRFVEQGKKNILIVSPSTGINDGWIDSGKKFGLNIVPLKNKKDNGNNNISITTLNNFTSNKTLVKRNWDLVVIDECHKLISNQNNKETGAIKNLRAITLNERGFNTRFDYLYPEENSNSELRIELKNQWKQIQEKDKPKVLFLSATPFSHVKNIDYAEGYLFNYDRQNGNLSTEEAHDKFFVKNFGYKIRYNRLEQPDPDVDNSIMEMEFHEKLKNDGAISSRRLVIDKDYDRGFILVDGGIGKKVDEGFEYLFNSKNNYTNLANFLNKSYGYYNKLFLLEAVKAREAIKVIKEYKKTGKKIVVFHRYLKNESKHPFKLSFDDEQFKSLTSYTKNRIKDEYERFCKERPDLVNLDLSELTSPIQTLTEAFGDKIAIYNGSLSAKEKNDSLSKFNDDNSEVDVILVQADAGSAGISLHDKTGKHQRVLINLGLPTKPVEAIQTEGRIYRVGQKTNAIFRYLNTGTSMERTAFATNIAQRSETVENLALGEEARNLKQSFVEAFQETIDSDEWKKNLPGNSSEGTGGKEKDYANQNIKTAYDKAKTFYYANQKKTSKNKSSEGKDYFATPEPIGLKMVEWSRLKDGESALEPSAGHGAIARWFPATTKNVAIEPSSQLADLTRMSFNGKVRDIPFENLDTINKFDAVIMNPPFGQGGKTAIEHVAKAFKHLRDGGRIVAIILNGPACQKHFDKWYASEEATSAILIKEIILPGIAFNKAGTSISTKVVIIDKQTTKEGQQATKINVSTSLDLSHIKNINELFDTIENLEIVDRVNPYNIEYSLDESTDDKEKNKINVNNDIDSESYVKKGDSSIKDEVSSEENTIKEHDDEKSVMENEEYFDQVIKQINPYYEVPKNKETINKLREKEDTIAKKREILKNFNSVRTGAMLSERADRYIFTIRNPLILELTAQYESADLDKIFHDLAIKNNGRDENIHYGSDKGEFYSWFKRDALNYCQYSFKSLSDMEAFSTEISEFYNDFLNKDFVIKQVLPDKIFVYITPKSSARELSITEIDKIAKKYGNLDAFERIRAYAYPFKTQEQASNFVKELKNIANSKPFSIEQEGALTKVTISNNFRFRNLITNINKNRKIKAIVEKYNGTYKGIGSSSVMVLKNTPYYFESQQKAEAFLEELNDIAKRREYTDINIDDGNTNNSNNYFVLDDFKHTKTGEIYKRAYPIKYVDDFKTLITLAKKAGGFYSRYQSAGFLFATEQQRKSFLDAVNSVNNEEQDISNKLLKSYIGTHKDKESGGTIIGIKVPLNNRNYINYIEPALKKLDYQYVVKKPNNSRYHSALLFKNEKETKYLLNEIKENIRKDKFNKKYSGVGQMIPSLIDYDNLLTEDKLNRQEKALSDFGKIIGCPILYFNNDKAKNIRGAFSGGIMYLNRASNISPRWTFYHEFIHWLKGTNPEVFAEIRKAIGEVSAKRILEYRDEIVGGNDTFDGKPLLTDEDIIEEMIADHMYNTSTRVSLNKLMVKNNPTIWQRFVAFWHNLLDKFRALYSIPLGLDKEQGKNMNIAMEKLVTSIKNKDGQLLFKRTKNGLVFANNNETVLNNKEFKIKPASIEVYSSQKEKLSSSKSNGFLDKMKLYWNGRKSTAKPIQIKQALELISGYTFEMGRIQTKDDVVTNHVAKIIRTKKAFDYPAMLEAVSPILAEKLGFKNDMAMQQYIANYIFDVASARNDEANYHKLVTAINNQQMMSKFNHLQSLFSDLKSMSARDKLRENRVSDDNMPKSGLKKLLHEMYLKNHDQWVDRYGPVKRMVDKFEKTIGQKLEITNPYKQFRLVAGSAGTGIAFIEGKKGVVNQSLQAIFPNIDFSNFKSLQTILIDNGINKDSEKLEELADYSLAMYYKDNPKNKPSFMKNKDLDEVINTTDDNIKQAHKELIDYQFKLFELMTDAGLISRQQLREMRITHKNYVPMYKYFDENDNLLFRKEITKEENNDRLTVNPIEGVVVNTYKTMRIIAKNKAKLSLTTLANDKMIAPYIKIEQVANKGEDAKTTFSVMINGKKQTYKADKDIIDMMRDLDTETGSNFLKKIIYKISSIMRSVFTISNPEFGFSNFFRDLASVTYYNKYSMRPMDIWHGFSSFFHKDKYYWEYIASGAAQTAAVSMDRNYTQASLNKIYKHSWKSMAKWKNLPQDILNIFQYISEASEMGLRIAHYRAGLRKMSVDKSINRQDIAYDTRDIMDFSRGGKAGRELNRYVLFANASIQGWSKFFRDVESYGLKYGLAKGGALLAYKITKYAILPALILFLLNKDDDKYKETPQWLRDTHWILPLGDKIIRIPKAMEPSILIISSLMERALNYSYNKDKEAFNNAHVLLFDQLPDIFPTLLKPLMETAANYSLFREGNIVPLSKQNDMPYMQYDEHTSGVSKMLGKAFNISPMKMDYLLYGYTGNYGRLATKVLDVSVIPKEYAQKKSSYDNLVSKENLLAWPWEDVVFLRRFMYTPYKNARSLTQFYEDFHYQQALYNEYKDTGIRPKEFNERYYERLKEAQKKMRDIKKMQQKIIDNTTQSANARQLSLDNVNKKRLDIARKALQYK